MASTLTNPKHVEQVRTLSKKLWDMADVVVGHGVSYTDFWAALTYLLFIKMDSELIDWDEQSHLPESCQWQSLLTASDDLGQEVPLLPEQRLAHYNEIIATLSASDYPDALVRGIFAKAHNKIDHPLYFTKVIEMIDSTNWLDLRTDVKGALYESILERNGQDVRSGAGQYFTPRVLVQVMTELTDPRPNELVWDPACGTAGFLIEAYDHMRKQTDFVSELEFIKEHGLRGQDNTPIVVTMASMNMFLHGFEGKQSPISLGDSLMILPQEKADVILTNPPFGDRAKGGISIERSDFVAKTNNNQLNFLQHIMSLLKDGGRAAVVMPEGILYDKAGKEIRRTLLTKFNLHTMLRLPHGLFYVERINTYVLFFTKGQPTRDIWVYDLRTDTNFSLVKNRLQLSDFDDFVQCYQATERGTFGRRAETYDQKSNPNGRWRKFTAAQFLNDKLCRIKLPVWMTPPPTEFEQMSLKQLLLAMSQAYKNSSQVFDHLQSELSVYIKFDAKE